MKKKIFRILVFSALILILILCGALLIIRHRSSSSHESPDRSLPTAESFLDLTNTTIENETGLDGHPVINCLNLAAGTDEGVYFFNDSFLCYRDHATGQTIYVCNRADCSHTDNTCNAFFNHDMFGEYYDTNSILYYDGDLYMIGFDSDQNVCLFRISPDGSSRENCMQLYSADFTDIVDGENTQRNWATPEVCIHRGYVYYILPEETESRLRRKKLGSSSGEEILVQAPAEHGEIYRITPAGDYIFFQVGIYDDSYTTLNGGIYAYHTSTGDITLVKDHAVNTFSLKGNSLYYLVAGEGIHSFSLETGEDRLAVEFSNIWCDFYVADNAIITYNGEISCAYAPDGSLLKAYEGPQISQLAYADHKYIYADAAEDFQSTFLMLPLDSAGSGDSAWEDISPK